MLTYEALNELTHTLADAIDKATGQKVDRLRVNDELSALLSGFGITFRD